MTNPTPDLSQATQCTDEIKDDIDINFESDAICDTEHQLTDIVITGYQVDTTTAIPTPEPTQTSPYTVENRDDIETNLESFALCDIDDQITDMVVNKDDVTKMTTPTPEPNQDTQNTNETKEDIDNNLESDAVCDIDIPESKIFEVPNSESTTPF